MKTREGKKGKEVFDLLRKKFVALTPEEAIRQEFVEFLISQKQYPESLMGNEVSFTLPSGITARCDTVVYDNDLRPLMIIEYKNPSIKIDQSVFDQISRYNIMLHVPYLIIANGISQYCVKINYDDLSCHFLHEIPNYEEIKNTFLP